MCVYFNFISSNFYVTTGHQVLEYHSLLTFIISKIIYFVPLFTLFISSLRISEVEMEMKSDLVLPLFVFYKICIVRMLFYLYYHCISVAIIF